MIKTSSNVQDLPRKMYTQAKADKSWRFKRHMMRARKYQGFGWKSWSRAWLYEQLGLFSNYRVVRL